MRRRRCINLVINLIGILMRLERRTHSCHLDMVESGRVILVIATNQTFFTIMETLLIA